MAQITFHQPFQWDASAGPTWMVIFADGFYSNGPPTRRGEIVSGTPQEWVFRGTSYAGVFNDWTVTVRPAAGFTFTGPVPFYNTPVGSIATIEIRNPAGVLVASITEGYVESVDALAYTNPLSYSDTFTGSSGDDWFNSHGGNDTLDGDGGADRLSGNQGNDTIRGGDGADVIDGGVGNDILEGGSGADTITGGEGEDRIYWDAEDSIDAGAGSDTIDFSRATNGVALNLDAVNAEKAFGSAFNDVISGSSLIGVSLEGEGGDDRLTGGAGDDYLAGDAYYGQVGDDRLEGGGGDDRLIGYDGNDTLLGGDGADRLEGGRGNDTVYGEGGDDSIWLQGDFDADYLNGGDGDDFIRTTDGGALLGGAGDDVIELGVPTAGDFAVTYGLIDGGDGHDVITIFANGLTTVRLGVLEAGSGFLNFETVNLAFGTDTVLIGSDANETLSGDHEVRGEGGDDVLYGEALYGGAGDDVLFGGGSGFTLIRDGGEGFDVVSYAHSYGGSVQVSLLAGSWGNETFTSIEGLIGSSGNDQLTGDGVGNALDGLAGDDTLTGGAGDDTLNGGTGADELFGGADHDVLLGGSGNDLLQGDDGDDALNGGANDDVLNGNLGDDLLQGGSGADELNGGQGVDVLRGGSENDVLRGGAADDSLNGGSGADVLNGGDGVDTATYLGATTAISVNLATGAGSGGWAEDDIYVGIENLYGSNKGDALTGSAIGNVLNGAAGDDVVDGGLGDDVLQGGAGDDQVLGGSGLNTLYGGDGNDGVIGGADADYLNGGDGADLLQAGSGNDTLVGGAGNDLMQGGNGDDELNGGAGNDSLNGGAGADRFVFLGAWGQDRITGFAAGAGAGDVIAFSTSQFADFAAVLAATTDDGSGNAVITRGSNTITLTGVSKAQLNADDFVFTAPAGSPALKDADALTLPPPGDDLDPLVLPAGLEGKQVPADQPLVLPGGLDDTALSPVTSDRADGAAWNALVREDIRDYAWVV